MVNRLVCLVFMSYQCGRVTSSARNLHAIIFLSCVVYFYLAHFHIVDQLFNLFVVCTVPFAHHTSSTAPSAFVPTAPLSTGRTVPVFIFDLAFGFSLLY